MRAYVIGNRGDDDPGFVGERLDDLGFSLHILTRESPDTWHDLEDVDLVVSLGSEWSVYWDHVRDEVTAELALLGDARDRGIPMLGLCFGSQVLATLLGGHVEKSPEAEVGWHTVTPTAAADGLIEPGPWMQWHYDRWSLPPGAELLATNAIGNQAFRKGRVLATQFHPEVTPAMVDRWSASEGGAAELVRLGMDRAELLARTDHEVGRARPGAHALVDAALKLVTAG